jgi:hypothetical protein
MKQTITLSFHASQPGVIARMKLAYQKDDRLIAVTFLSKPASQQESTKELSASLVVETGVDKELPVTHYVIQAAFASEPDKNIIPVNKVNDIAELKGARCLTLPPKPQYVDQTIRLEINSSFSGVQAVIDSVYQAGNQLMVLSKLRSHPSICLPGSSIITAERTVRVKDTNKALPVIHYILNSHAAGSRDANVKFTPIRNEDDYFLAIAEKSDDVKCLWSPLHASQTLYKPASAGDASAPVYNNATTQKPR